MARRAGKKYHLWAQSLCCPVYRFSYCGKDLDHASLLLLRVMPQKCLSYHLLDGRP
jgi:hypothetical protein